MLPYDAESAEESADWQADNDWLNGVAGPEPTWSKPCDSCGETVERYRGQGDVTCPNGHCYNAGGQRLRDDWMGNSSWWTEDIDDMEGYERQMLAYEDGDY